MLGFLPTRAYRPGTPGATTFLSPLSGTFNYGWDSFEEPVQQLSQGPVAPPRFVTGATATLDGETVVIRTYETLEFFDVSDDGELRPMSRTRG